MAYQVVWSPKAIEDIEAIAAYISRDSPSYAAAIVQKLIDETRRLQDFPHSGSSVLEFEESGFREIGTYSYRVIYHIDEEIVTIATIVHSKGLLELQG